MIAISVKTTKSKTNLAISDRQIQSSELLPLQKSFKKSKTIDILGLAFFHNDEETSRYTVQDAAERISDN